MIVGVLEVQLHIPSSTSLKEKRMVIKSIKDKMTKKFNVSVAELDFQDKWQRSLLGFAVISAEKGFIEEVLQKMFQLLDADLRFELIQHSFIYK